jgi:hypothetical protein
MRIATRLFGERMYDQFAPFEAGLRHLLDQLEVPARLLFVPGRGSGRERHKVERRIVERMARAARGGARGMTDVSDPYCRTRRGPGRNCFVAGPKSGGPVVVVRESQRKTRRPP